MASENVSIKNDDMAYIIYHRKILNIKYPPLGFERGKEMKEIL